jgi:hypothetical protein
MDIAGHALGLLIEKLAGLCTALRYAIKRLRTSSTGLKIMVCVPIPLLLNSSSTFVC